MSRCQPWTEDEISFLLDNPRMSAREAGLALGRGQQSVKHKRAALARGDVLKVEPWTESERDFIRSTPNMTARAVATHLGRTAHAVATQRIKLGVAVGKGARNNPHEVGARRLIAKTCPRCGLLLEASWFGYLGGSKRWRSACFRCAPTEHRKQRPDRGRGDGGRALQNLTLERATKSGEPWTDADHEVLADPGLLTVEKALKLGRTYFATHTAVHKNGYTSKVGRGDAAKGQWVIHNPNALEVAA